MAAQKDYVNVAQVLTIGVVSVLIILIIVFGMQAWFGYEESGEISRKWDASTNVQLDALRAGQRDNLDKPRIVERDGRKFQTIRIDEAINTVAAQGGKLK